MAPWGAEADDERAGVIAACVANFGGMGRRKPVGADDLIPRLRREGKPPRRKTQAELREAGIRAFGGA